MKTFNLFALFASFALLFSNCSTNENLLSEEETSSNLLKTYTVKRDASGAYSIAYDLNDNAETESVLDNETNTNNIYLYASDKLSLRSLTQDLTIGNTQLRVGFVDTNSAEHAPNITIIDGNIVLAKGANKNEEKLTEYSITGNEDGTYTLDFKTKEQVVVDFVYNEESQTYEIHLEEGAAAATSFSRVLEKTDGQPLKFDFVNHLNTAAKSNKAYIRRKPRGIIV